MASVRQSTHSWTKEEIRKVLDLWETKSTIEVATELGVRREQVQYISAALRKAGFKLPRKKSSRGSHLRNLIQELHSEIYGK